MSLHAPWTFSENERNTKWNIFSGAPIEKIIDVIEYSQILATLYARNEVGTSFIKFTHIHEC